jgi:hypothetical protein
MKVINIMLSPKHIFGSTFLVLEEKFLQRHVEQWDHPHDMHENSVESYTFEVTKVGEGGKFNCSMRTIFHISYKSKNESGAIEICKRIYIDIHKG